MVPSISFRWFLALGLSTAYSGARILDPSISFRWFLALGLGLLGAPLATAQVALPNAKPIPQLQVLPHANSETAIERAGVELVRYHFGEKLPRPFLYPIVGPSGKSLTRIGHPHDPQSHSHHNSLWVSHFDVNGVDFWGDHDPGKGKIVTQRIVRYEDGDDLALLEFVNAWQDATGKTLLNETRTVRLYPGVDKQYLLVLDLELSAAKEPVTIGKTPFGLVGVRMAKTIGVHDGGGTIRNSQGGRDEAEVLWKQAKWVDYSGPITNQAAEGITLLDHPQNPNHPTFFHVRNDGWMGTSLTYEAARTIVPDQPLKLRYGFWIHAGVPEAKKIEEVFAGFAEIGPPPAKKK